MKLFLIVVLLILFLGVNNSLAKEIIPFEYFPAEPACAITYLKP